MHAKARRARPRHVTENIAPLQIEAPPGHPAGVVSGEAGSANLGSRDVDRARRSDADVADKSRTAIAEASHASQSVIDQGFRDPIEIGIAFQ